MNSLSLTSLNHRVDMVIMNPIVFVHLHKQIYLNLVHILRTMIKEQTKDRKLGGRK